MVVSPDDLKGPILRAVTSRGNGQAEEMRDIPFIRMNFLIHNSEISNRKPESIRLNFLGGDPQQAKQKLHT